MGRYYTFSMKNCSHILDLPILPRMHNLANRSCYCTSLHSTFKVPQFKKHNFWFYLNKYQAHDWIIARLGQYNKLEQGGRRFHSVRGIQTVLCIWVQSLPDCSYFQRCSSKYSGIRLEQQDPLEGDSASLKHCSLEVLTLIWLHSKLRQPAWM